MKKTANWSSSNIRIGFIIWYLNSEYCIKKISGNYEIYFKNRLKIDISKKHVHKENCICDQNIVEKIQYNFFYVHF